MAVDFRKLLIAQMIACNDFDGGWPSVEDEWVALTPDESAAWQEANDEARRLLQTRGGWRVGMENQGRIA